MYNLNTLTLSILIVICANPSRRSTESIQIIESRQRVRSIEFCEFPKNLGTQVKTKFVFTGMDEYWSLSGLKSCADAISVEFNYSNVTVLSAPHFHQRLKRLHNQYWKYKLVIEAVGVFEIDSINGYGHLNSNKAIFRTERILFSKLLRKKYAG